MTNHDPVSRDYVPAYEETEREVERLERCVQQQVEDLFTTLSRIQDLKLDYSTRHRWQTLREGLRCWRLAVRASQ